MDLILLNYGAHPFTFEGEANKLSQTALANLANVSKRSILNIEHEVNVFDEKKHIKELLPENLKADYDWIIKTQNFQHKHNSNQDIELLKETKEKIWNEIGLSTDYDFSTVIIEEPEQNLFPETQKELIYHLLNKVSYAGRNHNLILTTHSPYILYALNNCLLGGLVEKNIPDNEQNDFLSRSSWIDPKLVSVKRKIVW